MTIKELLGTLAGGALTVSNVPKINKLWTG